jgi:hypothetical protein
MLPIYSYLIVNTGSGRGACKVPRPETALMLNAGVAGIFFVEFNFLVMV